MSRRSGRNSVNVPSYAEVEEDLDFKVQPTTPSKKNRKSNLLNQETANDSDIALVSSKSKSSVTKRKSEVEVDVIATKTILKAEKASPNKLAGGVAVVKDGNGELTTKKNLKRTPKAEAEVKTEEYKDQEEEAPSKGSKKRKVGEEGEAAAETDKKVKKPRKSKEEKESEAMPLAARTLIPSLGKAMHIGAHVSAAGGVDKSIFNAVHIGSNSFALFLKSQRKWTSPPLSTEARDAFLSQCKEHNYDASKHVLPHGSYLVNLAQEEPEKAEQAYACFLDDLKRCESLGIGLYNFHPGNTGSHPRPEAIKRIAAQLNKAHKATKGVITVLENMAGSGNTIGSTFEDLRDIIALIEDKSRVGVCIDTCHTFAAGYDLRTPEAFKVTMEKFSEIVGEEYLKALHLNDSKAPFASNRDLHANIGTGFLGLRAFHNVMNYAPFQGLPMVLETPIDKKGADGKVIEDKSMWATEIKLLEGLIGRDTENEEFKEEETRLQALGKSEREKFQGQADKKIQKGQKTLDGMFKSSGKGKAAGKTKKKSNVEDGSGSDGGCSH